MMKFDREQFISDVKMVEALMERASDLQTPDYHRDHYIDQASEPRERIEQVFRLLERMDNMTEALTRICYDDQVSDYSSNPNFSPFHICYLAMGGEMIAGVLQDSEASIREKVNHAYKK